MNDRLILIVGPSGVGKTSLVNRLTNDARLKRVVTTTTRLPRPGEVNGRDYNFISEEEFRLRAFVENTFIERAKVHDDYYGTELQAVKSVMSQGFIPLLITDVQGLEFIQKVLSWPASPIKVKPFSIFVRPDEPWRATLYVRLKKRGDTQEQIERRLASAEHEMRLSELCDIQVVNKDLDRTVEALRYVLRD